VLQYALTHLVMVIGEAASRITGVTRDKHPEVPWKEITGMRHRLVHDYYAVNLKVLWTTISEDLQPLVDSLTRILRPRSATKRTRRPR
jgi:uncharacterized protein with HEPN domain